MSPGFRVNLGGIGGRIGAGFGGLMFTGMPVILIGVFTWMFIQDVRIAATYQPVAAFVTQVEGHDAEVDKVAVTYQYAVADVTYSGTLKADEDNASEFNRLRQFAVGQKLAVYYDPRSPATNVESVGPKPIFLGAWMFCTPFLLIGVNLLVRAFRGREFIPIRQTADGNRWLGGPATLVFILACCVCGMGQMIVATLIDWRAGLVSGVALLATVVAAPLLTRRASRRREMSRAASGAGPARPDPSPAADAPAPLGSLKKKMTGLLLGTLFWCGLTGLFVYFIVGAIVRHQYAKAFYRSTGGTVISSRVKESPGDSDSGPTYQPIVKYRYTVNGREYVSHRYSFGTFGSSNHGYAAGVVEDHPAGKAVTVYYDPGDPASAILHLEVPSVTYFLLLFLQPFMLVGLAMICATCTLPWLHRRLAAFLAGPAQVPCTIPTWGFLAEEMGGVAIQGRAHAAVVAVALCAGYGLTCFVSIFLVAFLGSPETIPPWTIGLILLGAAGVGGAASIVTARKVARKARLHIDPGRGWLRLTSPQREVELPLRQIQAWAVRPIPNPRSVKSDGDTATAPLLVVLTTAGEEVPIHVFKADADAPAVARKTAELLAALTHKPVAAPEERQPATGNRQPESPKAWSFSTTGSRVADAGGTSSQGTSGYSDLT